MPFKSKSQMRACFAKKSKKWNCKKWLRETKNVKNLPEKLKSMGGMLRPKKKCMTCGGSMQRGGRMATDHLGQQKKIVPNYNFSILGSGTPSQADSMLYKAAFENYINRDPEFMKLAKKIELYGANPMADSYANALNTENAILDARTQLMAPPPAAPRNFYRSRKQLDKHQQGGGFDGWQASGRNAPWTFSDLKQAIDWTIMSNNLFKPEDRLPDLPPMTEQEAMSMVPEVPQMDLPMYNPTELQDLIDKGILETPPDYNQEPKKRRTRRGINRLGLYNGLHAGQNALAFIGSAMDRGRQNSYMANQMSTLGQIDPIPVENFQPNPYSLYARFGGKLKKGGWIQKAVNPKHKGYCTPMSKPTCTPRRKALARRFKAMAKD